MIFFFRAETVVHKVCMVSMDKMYLYCNSMFSFYFACFICSCFLFLQRFAERESEFKKMSYSDMNRVKWKVLVQELISSDESGIEDGEATLVSRNFIGVTKSQTFVKLDRAHESHKSEQGSRQTKPHIRNGTDSARPAPFHLPTWAISSHSCSP